MGYVKTQDFSLLVGTTPVTVPLQFPGLSAGVGTPGTYATFMSITNVASAENPGSEIWLSRSGIATVGDAGSHRLKPGESQTFRAPQHIPTKPLSVVATAAGVPLTIEIG